MSVSWPAFLVERRMTSRLMKLTIIVTSETSTVMHVPKNIASIGDIPLATSLFRKALTYTWTDLIPTRIMTPDATQTMT